jgi:hypothetical protein
MLSDHQISTLCQAWTKSKFSTSSPSKHILRQLRKRKSSRPLNSKPDGLRRMHFLVLQKDGLTRFARIQLRLTLHQIRTPN